MNIRIIDRTFYIKNSPLSDFGDIIKSYVQLFLVGIYGLFFLTDSYEFSDPEFS